VVLLFEVLTSVPLRRGYAESAADGGAELLFVIDCRRTAELTLAIVQNRGVDRKSGIGVGVSCPAFVSMSAFGGRRVCRPQSEPRRSPGEESHQLMFSSRTWNCTDMASVCRNTYG
jgi:hypothetical protein